MSGPTKRRREKKKYQTRALPIAVKIPPLFKAPSDFWKWRYTHTPLKESPHWTHLLLISYNYISLEILGTEILSSIQEWWCLKRWRRSHGNRLNFHFTFCGICIHPPLADVTVEEVFRITKPMISTMLINCEFLIITLLRLYFNLCPGTQT